MSPAHPADGLVGRMVAISVGEPWDFKSADGENLLNGRITAALAEAVTLEVTPFELGGVTFNRLEAHRRYQEDRDLVGLLLTKGDATVNLGSDAKPYGPVLIGSLVLLPLKGKRRGRAPAPF